MTRLPIGTPAFSGEDGNGQFQITTQQTSACTVLGFPTAVLSDSTGRTMPFAYRQGGGPYVTSRPPTVVVLRSGNPGYFIVTKYRCDSGHAASARTLAVRLPGQRAGRAFSFSESPASFDYCIGGANPDPGNTVTISPVVASLRAALS